MTAKTAEPTAEDRMAAAKAAAQDRLTTAAAAETEAKEALTTLRDATRQTPLSPRRSSATLPTRSNSPRSTARAPRTRSPRRAAGNGSRCSRESAARSKPGPGPNVPPKHSSGSPTRSPTWLARLDRRARGRSATGSTGSAGSASSLSTAVSARPRKTRASPGPDPGWGLIPARDLAGGRRHQEVCPHAL